MSSYDRIVRNLVSTMAPFEGMFDRQLSAWFLRPLPTGGARSAGPHNIGIATDTGLARLENQDRAATCQACDKFGHKFVLSMVADGIGGLQAGAQAASIALAVMADSVYQSALLAQTKPSAWLEKAIKDANEFLHGKYRGKSGTTLTAVLVTQAGKSCWASVGDSRLYEYSSNKLTQWSIDDTLAGIRGIQQEDAISEQKMLLQHIGIGPDLVVKVHEFDKKEPRKLLLCSDGTYFVSPDGRLFAKFLETGKDLPQPVVARRMVEVSKWAGGPDNSSAILIDLPLDLESLRGEDVGLLNVWDSFGEMTYLVNIESRTQPFKPQSPRPTQFDAPSQEKNAPATPKPALIAPREDQASKPKKEKRKSNTKRKSNARKKTSSQIGNDASEEQLEAPQVQLKFSQDTDD